MAVIVSDDLTGTAGAALADGVRTPSGPWAKGGTYSKIPTLTDDLVFTNTSPQRVRHANTGTAGANALNATAPATNQVIVVGHATFPAIAGSVNLANLRVNSPTNQQRYAVVWSATVGGIFISKTDSTGAALGVGGVFRLNGLLYTYAPTIGATLSYKIVVTNDASSKPHFQIYLQGSTSAAIDTTDSDWAAAAYTNTGKYGFGVGHVTSDSDTNEAQLIGPFTVVDYVSAPALYIVNPAAVTPGATVNLYVVGAQTAWVQGTTTFSPSGYSATVNSVTILDAIHATVNVTLGNGPSGTLTLTDNSSPTASGTVTVTAGTVTPATGLSLSGPLTALAGQASDPLLIGLLPPGNGLNADLVVDLSDGGAGGGFGSGPQVQMGTSVWQALTTYTPASIGPSSTTPQVVTLGAADHAASLNPSAMQITVYRPATTYLLSGPASGASGQQSGLFTVALTSGEGVDGALGLGLSDGGSGGVFTTENPSLTTNAPSVTFRYTPPADYSGTIVISVTNNGGLSNPSPLTYVVVRGADVTLAGPTNGAMNTATSPAMPLVVALAVPAFPGGDTLATLSDGGVEGTFDGGNTTGTGDVVLTLDETVHSIPVTWTPPTDYTGPVTFSVSNNRGLANPGVLHYQVYDPALSYAQTVDGGFGPAFAGQAATLGFVVWGPSGLYLDNSGNPLGLTVEAGDQSGSYFASVVLPLDFYGQLRWDVPSGGTAPSISQGISPNTNRGPLLSALDTAAVAAKVATTGVRLATFAAMGITTFTAAQVRADPNYLLKMLVSALVNKPAVDADGNLLYKADDGTTVLLTIPVNDDDGTFSLGAPE